MKAKSYHTIDPLILQTLNLNQKRIHQILDILHGRDQTTNSRRQIKPNSRHFSPISNYHQNFQQTQLKKSKNLPRLMKPRGLSIPMEDHFRSKKNISTIQPNLRRNKQKQRHYQTPALSQEIRINKTQQMLQKYKVNKIREVQSQINIRDVYRQQIQSVMSQLTSIQDLQNSEKRMKRIKKRYQHLIKFDNVYYSKLNESQYNEL